LTVVAVSLDGEVTPWLCTGRAPDRLRYPERVYYERAGFRSKEDFTIQKRLTAPLMAHIIKSSLKGNLQGQV
jgi:hypothetical protein